MASDELMAGAEIQANALSTVMRGVPLRDAPAWIAAALVVLLAVLGHVLASRLSPAWLAAATIATLALTAAVSYAVLLAGVVMQVAAAAVALLIGACVGGVARQLRARRRERELRAVLARLAGTATSTSCWRAFVTTSSSCCPRGRGSATTRSSARSASAAWASCISPATCPAADSSR